MFALLNRVPSGKFNRPNNKMGFGERKIEIKRKVKACPGAM